MVDGLERDYRLQSADGGGKKGGEGRASMRPLRLRALRPTGGLIAGHIYLNYRFTALADAMLRTFKKGLRSLKEFCPFDIIVDRLLMTIT